MRILLAADGSEYTKRAASHLAKHLGWFAGKPEIHVLHIRRPLTYPGAAAYAGKNAVEDYERDEAHAALKVAGRVLDKAKIKYTAAWNIGDIAVEIDSYVHNHRIDLIVLGSHGHGALVGLALGSVATKVIATSAVPVLVIR